VTRKADVSSLAGLLSKKEAELVEERVAAARKDFAKRAGLVREKLESA